MKNGFARTGVEADEGNYARERIHLRSLVIRFRLVNVFGREYILRW